MQAHHPTPSPPHHLTPSPPPVETVAVLGAGSWGTALAWMLGTRGVAVTLWCRDTVRAAEMRATRRNSRYLPETLLPETVQVTSDLACALGSADVLVLAVPAQALRPVLAECQPCVRPDVPVLIAAKGLEQGTALRLSQVAAEVLAPSERGVRPGARPPPLSALRPNRGSPVECGVGKAESGVLPDAQAPSELPAPRSALRTPHSALRTRIAVLSGPNLAGELVRAIPTTTVVAAADGDLGRRLQQLLAAPFFRVYTNSDVVGVELGGALKNVVALAAGISDGLGFGDNTKAALVTRGLAEMVRLGGCCGARAGTFMGLSGLGDLVATCGSRLSRNHTLGERLGRGEALPAALGALGHVAEGVPTTAAALRLARQHAIEMPITEEVYRVLYEDQSPRNAVAALMSRAFREEAS